MKVFFSKFLKPDKSQWAWKFLELSLSLEQRPSGGKKKRIICLLYTWRVNWRLSVKNYYEILCILILRVQIFFILMLDIFNNKRRQKGKNYDLFSLFIKWLLLQWYGFLKRLKTITDIPAFVLVFEKAADKKQVSP